MIERAYQGVALSDTTITAKVKSPLHENKITGGADIQVDTVAGVVTLKGMVPSADASATAQQVAKETNGVKGVKNQLTMVPTTVQ